MRPAEDLALNSLRQLTESRGFVCAYVCSGSKMSSRQCRPATSDSRLRNTDDSPSGYQRRHANERPQPMTDVEDVEPDSDVEVIPPSPVRRW